MADAVLLLACRLLRLPPPPEAARRAAVAELPRLATGEPLTACLPGGLRFALAGTPSCCAAPRLAAPQGSVAVCTASPRGYCHLQLHNSGAVEMVAYVGGDATMSVALLSVLVGKPATLLSMSLQHDVLIGQASATLPALPCIHLNILASCSSHCIAMLLCCPFSNEAENAADPMPH